jgi:small subunit ribosomal protein S18
MSKFKNKKKQNAKRINLDISKFNYKNPNELYKFLNRQGRIVNKSGSQLNSKSQRIIAREIKRARQMGLLPYSIINQNQIEE